MSKIRRMLIALVNAVSYIFYSASILLTNKTTDTVVFAANPCLYQSYYRIRFDYKITVRALPTSTMLFALQNTGAFTYAVVRNIVGSVTTLGEYTGSVDTTVQALKNSGTNMNFIFRPYGGLADIELSNVRVEKVS